VTKSGQLQCHINGDQDEPLLTGLPVNRPLWLVLDLYGNTCSARFVKRGNLQVVMKFFLYFEGFWVNSENY
jgi:hypothetical protein